MLRLKPGVNVEMTPSQVQAGYAASNLGRFRSGLFEKLGGWSKFYAFVLGGIPKALLAWLDLNSNQYVGVGTTTNLSVITNTAIPNTILTTITPQTKTTDLSPNITTSATSSTVRITDPNISNVTRFDAVAFNTPVSVGGLILSGVYPIASSISTHAFTIVAASAATTTIATGTISGATQANPCVVTSAAHGFANGQIVYIDSVVGMIQLNGRIYTVDGVTANTFQLSGVNSTAYTVYSSGGSVYGAAVPQFGTTSTSSTVTVTLASHGLSVGDTVVFQIATTVGGVTIQGSYAATAVGGANTFNITCSQQASSTTTGMMNSGNVELVYYIALGPPAASAGYGTGTYGTGGYGTGSTSSAQTGTAITATNWSMDNWGQTLLACPEGGGIYAWTPNTGFQNSQLIPGGPLYNAGIFVSMQTQMLIAFGSTVDETVGVQQDPLLVKWSDQADYTSWAVSTVSQAGSRRLPTGSKIVGGMSVPQNELIWTDLDLWSMAYLGGLTAGVWSFTKIGSNCGLVGKHATARQGSNVYWMSASNFFATGGSVPAVIPCSIWDVVFQDLNTAYQTTCWTWSNTPFNEIWFFYPRRSTGATSPDAYAKLNTLDGSWDYGPLDRSCGIDQSLAGMPIAAASTGLIYEHEISPDADGQPIKSTMTSGWFPLSDGQDIVFVDWVLPDMTWVKHNGTGSASIQLTFYSVYYPGETPRTYGPYTVTQATKYINPRIRGRLAKIEISSNDIGSFWRLGGLRMRIAPDGRL